MSHIQQVKKNLRQMIQMNKSHMNKDEATSTSHIIQQRTYSLIYPLVLELDPLFRNFCAFSSFVSFIEPMNHLEALDDLYWVITVRFESTKHKRGMNCVLSSIAKFSQKGGMPIRTCCS